jgi:hypothetical protein
VGDDDKLEVLTVVLLVLLTVRYGVGGCIDFFLFLVVIAAAVAVVLVLVVLVREDDFDLNS